MTRNLSPLLALLILTGCQNWDLMRPENERGATAERSFTRLDPDDPGPLTGEVARRRVEAIRGAIGADRLALIDAFFEDFPEARLLSLVHGLAGEAHLAVESPAAAADSFQRAVDLTRADLLGVPLDSALPLQLGMSLLASGRYDDGVAWLWRAHLVDRADRVEQALRWAHADGQVARPFDGWLRDGIRSVSVTAPDFDLPGLQQPRVALDAVRGAATLINFWSPT